jgi:serine/threonine-protein kinase
VPREGQILAEKYLLERFLGSGGFASVWAARNVELDRPVALKVLSDTFSRAPGVVARFVREAKLAARQVHETIVRVEDIGRTEDGVPFLVMELLEGETVLAALKRGGALPLAEAIDVARLVLQGLAAAHAQGIIHRDVKPGNVFLTRSGHPGPRVRILDLGLAKELSDVEGLTRTGEMMGTPDYLAPEILLSDVWSAAEPASDVFACGVLLFEMLAGRRPLDGLLTRDSSTSGFLRRANYYQQGGTLPGLAPVAPGVPAAIVAVVAKALSVSVEERYRDARAMLDALEQAVAAGVKGDESGDFQDVIPTALAPALDDLSPPADLGSTDLANQPTVLMQTGDGESVVATVADRPDAPSIAVASQATTVPVRGDEEAPTFVGALAGSKRPPVQPALASPARPAPMQSAPPWVVQPVVAQVPAAPAAPAALEPVGRPRRSSILIGVGSLVAFALVAGAAVVWWASRAPAAAPPSVPPPPALLTTPASASPAIGPALAAPSPARRDDDAALATTDAGAAAAPAPPADLAGPAVDPAPPAPLAPTAPALPPPATTAPTRPAKRRTDRSAPAKLVIPFDEIGSGHDG